MEFLTYLSSLGRTPFTEAVFKVYTTLFEGCTDILYHFVNCESLLGILSKDRLITNKEEASYNKAGYPNSISFSRTGSFREGFPTLLHADEWCKGDDWCMIRLKIDGNALSRMNQVIEKDRRKRVHVEPFDWAYHEYGKSIKDEFSLENDDSNPVNGKEWMMASNGNSTSSVPVGPRPIKCFGKYTYSDREAHPYAQAEDRLMTDADAIPQAHRIIEQISIVLVRNNFTEENLQERKRLRRAILMADKPGKPFYEHILIYCNEDDMMSNNVCMNGVDVLVNDDEAPDKEQFNRPHMYDVGFTHVDYDDMRHKYKSHTEKARKKLPRIEMLGKPTADGGVQIGNQVWMNTDIRVDDGKGGIDKDSELPDGGYIYTWEAANRVADMTDGWRLPTVNDFEKLSFEVGTSLYGGEQSLKYWTADDSWMSGKKCGYTFGSGTVYNGHQFSYDPEHQLRVRLIRE